MIKSIYEFTKIFAFLFLLTGIFFATKAAFILAAIAIASFAIILFINSDWFFDNFVLKNHNQFVIFITFVLILVNFGAIWQEFKDSAMFVRLSDEEKQEYVNFQKDIYTTALSCVGNYNDLTAKMKNGDKIAEDDVKTAHNICYAAIRDITNKEVPEKMNTEVKNSSLKIKDDFKKIVVNISYYNYSNTDKQENVTKRLKENYTILINDVNKNQKKWDIDKKDILNIENFVKF